MKAVFPVLYTAIHKACGQVALDSEDSSPVDTNLAAKPHKYLHLFSSIYSPCYYTLG